MLTKKTERVRWVCTNCGQSITKGDGRRPMPGRCARSPRRDGPHRWVKDG